MQWRKALSSINEYCVYLILFAAPLVFSERFFLSFELPKLVLFRSLVLILLFGTVCKVLLDKKISVPKILAEKKVRGIILGLVAILALSNVFALAPELSFWGSAFRLQGTYTFLHYLAFFLLLAVNFQKREQWESGLIYLGGGFLLVTLYAVLQFFGFEFSSFDLQAVSLGRAISTLGQPNYLASYVVVAMFPLLSLMIVRGWNWGLVGILILGCSAIAFSGSRGGVLGFVAAFVAFVALWFLFIKKQSKVVVAAVLMVVFCLGFVATNRIDLERSTDSRLHIWEVSIDALRDAPILGYGLDSFGLVFPRYTDGSLLKTERSNVNPDRTHSNILEILMSVGILGLALFAYAFWQLWRKSLRALKTGVKAGKIYLIGALSGVTGLFAANLVGFSMTAHYIMGCYLLGFLTFLISGDKLRSRELKVPKFFSFSIKIVFGLFTLGSILVYNVFVLYADQQFKNSFYELGHGNLVNTEILLSEATLLNPYQSHMYYMLAEARLAEGKKDQAAAAAVRGLEFNSYEDGHGFLLMGKIFEDSEYFHEALYLMPNSPRLLLNWGIFEVENDNCNLGSDFLQKYVDLLPSDWERPDTEDYRLFYKHNPRFDEALEYLDLCLEKS